MEAPKLLGSRRFVLYRRGVNIIPAVSLWIPPEESCLHSFKSFSLHGRAPFRPIWPKAYDHSASECL